MKNYLSSVFIKKIHFFLSFFLFIIFIASFILEITQNLSPCILCKIERWLYFTLSSVFFLASIWKKLPKFTCLIVVIFCLLISIYHKFVQYGVASCQLKTENATSDGFESFQLTLENTMPCSVKATFFGIELVWSNIVIFSAIACLQIFFLTKQKVKKN